MLFGEKKKSLSALEETLIVNQTIATSIDKLHTSVEGLVASLSTHINKIEVIKQKKFRISLFSRFLMFNVF